MLDLTDIGEIWLSYEVGCQKAYNNIYQKILSLYYWCNINLSCKM